MKFGGKETKDSGYATRGPREKLDQVTGKPTVTTCPRSGIEPGTSTSLSRTVPSTLKVTAFDFEIFTVFLIFGWVGELHMANIV